MKKRFDKTKKIMKKMPYEDLIKEHKELIKHIPKDDPEYKEQKEELAEYKEELAEKQGYFKGSLVQGTQGGGFNQGGSVPAFDSGTMFGRFFSGGAIEPYDQKIDRSGQFADGGEIKPASFMDNFQFKLRELMAKPGSRLAEMSEADKEAERNQQALEFLKMGRLPSKQNEPISPEDIASARQQLDNIQAMGMISGGIKNIGNLKFIPEPPAYLKKPKDPIPLPEKGPEPLPSRKNEFGYYPERPIRHIPDAPESLSSSERTPVTPSPSNLQEEAEKVNQYLKEQQLLKDELERQALSQKYKVPPPEYSQGEEEAMKQYFRKIPKR